MSDLPLLPKGDLEAVLGGQVPGPHVAVLAAAHDRAVTLYEGLHGSPHEAPEQDMQQEVLIGGCFARLELHRMPSAPSHKVHRVALVSHAWQRGAQ